MPTVKAHLGLRHNGWTTRQLRPQIEALIAAGSLKPGRQNNINVYAITSAGSRCAAPFRELPESPQHRRWRNARALAGQELPRLRAAVLEHTQQAVDPLNANGEASEPWLVLSHHLQHACATMASALHCLHEWPEPDDRRAEQPPLEIVYLRNTALWKI